VELSLDRVITSLTTGRQLLLASNCPYHRARWVASEIERNQIGEYASAVRISMTEPYRPRRYG